MSTIPCRVFLGLGREAAVLVEGIVLGEVAEAAEAAEEVPLPRLLPQVRFLLPWFR